ncbi:MAG: YgiT-type zinc finger protein [Leptospiraceae bacterium]|nr:YgiT-type zinc finger protein [Leptospiraceae bacterium]
MAKKFEYRIEKDAEKEMLKSYDWYESQDPNPLTIIFLFYFECASVGDNIAIAKVKVEKCDRCGENFYDPDTVRYMERIRKELKNRITYVEDGMSMVWKKV